MKYLKYFFIISFLNFIFTAQFAGAQVLATDGSKEFLSDVSRASSDPCSPSIDFNLRVASGCRQSPLPAAPAASSTTSSSNSNDFKPPDTTVMFAAIEACKRDIDTASSDCDVQKDSGVQSAQTTLSNFAVGIGSQMGIAAACSGIAKYVAGANAAVAYFAGNCSSARNTCMTSCQNAQSEVNATYSELPGPREQQQVYVTELLTTCKSFDAKIQQASKAIQNTVGTLQGAQACANQTDSTIAGYCASNPTAVGCSNAAADCSNPSIAASNPICICKNNPSAANCTGGAMAKVSNTGGSFDSASTSAISGGGGKAGVGSPGSDSLLGDASWAGDPNLKPDRSQSDEPGGNKGGRPLMDGGSAASGNNGDGKAGAAMAQGIAVNAGFRGGGGSGGWGNGGGNSHSNGGYAPPIVRQAEVKGPNLRDFLPGGGLDPKRTNRGLAGISGPDGITGPHSDIWKKVQNRYQVQVEKASLIP